MIFKEDPLVHIKDEVNEEGIQVDQNESEDNEEFEENFTDSDVDHQTDDDVTDEDEVSRRFLNL